MDALMLPLNWQRVRLGDICEITTGSLDANEMVHYGKYRFYTCAKEYYFIDKYAFDTEAILISGNGAYVGYVHYYKGKFNAYQRTYVLDNFSEHIIFVKYFLTMFLQSHIQTNKNEGNTPYIVMATLKDFEILLPPLNEQIAIANILSDVDRYLYSLDALILKKESVKKALSFELLSQRKRLKGFNQAWQRVRLGDMTTSFTKQTGFDYSASIKPTLIKEQLPNYIPFIQNKDFSGHYINYKTDYFIPNEIAIRFPQILLNEKCLLISIVGSIGNVAVFNHSQDAFTGCAIAVLKFKEKKSLDFVMHFLMSASGQKSLLNIVKASSHKSIILADLRDLLIPLPPLNEQIAIANILSTLDNEIISLKNKKRQFENIKKALNHDLMSAKIRVLKK